MKRVVGVLLVLAGLAAPAAAQQGAAAPKPALTFGLIGGLNLGSIDESSGGNWGWKPGADIGVTLSHRYSDTWSARAELHYSMKGASQDSAGTTVKIGLGMIDVPVLARASFGDQDLRPFIEAGPFVSFKASCNLSASGGGFTASASCADAGLPVKSMDYGAVVGAGVGFTMWQRQWSVLARYHAGLANLDDLSTGPTVKSKTIQLLLGLEF